MDATLRALTPADIPGWHALLAAVEAVERTGEHFSEADLAEEMSDEHLAPGKDLVGAFDEDGGVVGFFKVLARGESEGQHSLHLEGTVHPDRRGRGVGTALVSAMLRRAEEVHREGRPDLPARMSLTGVATNADQEALMASVGMLPERWMFAMRVPLAQLPPAAPLPEGYAFRRYDASQETALREAHNVAFLDHPGFTPWSASLWRQWVSGSRSFRPDLSYLVVPESDPERIVGYVQTNEWEAHQEATGRREAYVGKLGTLREHRGRGLAGALLQHCLHAYRDAGYDESALAVDAQNPTGALGVYERAGFTVECRFTTYVKVTPVP